MAATAETIGLGRFRPATVELARGLMLGEDPGAPRPPEAAAGADPLAAFEDAVRVALRHPPCLVAFSGGRDSAAVLAVAADRARREGLEAPVPVTIRFPPGARGADESRWQERVVAAAGVDDWDRIAVEPGELDWLGPIATTVLRRDGLLYPATIHFYEPLVRRARGGTLLTGFGGDELLEDWRWAAAGAPGSRPRRLSARALMAAYAAAPLGLRAWAHRAALSPAVPARLRPPGGSPAWPWLRPEFARASAVALSVEKAAEPAAWDARTRWQVRRRALNATVRSLDVLAARADATVAHPFLAPPFVAALAAAGGRGGLGTRTDAMRRLFGGRLPGDVLARSSKAGFGGVFWDETTRAFAAAWDGSGLPLDLVEPDALRHCWQQHRPPYSAALLLQAAWLARAPSTLT